MKNVVDVHIKSRRENLEERKKEMSQKDYVFFSNEIEDREKSLLSEIESGEIKNAGDLAFRMDALDQAVKQALFHDGSKDKDAKFN